MQKVNDQVLKFILVGIANTLVGTTIMFGLYNIFHCSYFFSTAMNYICGSTLSYFLNKRFTFKNNDRSLKQIFRFVFNIVVCYILAYGFAKPFVNFILGSFSNVIRDNISMFIGMVLFTVLNYFGQKYLVFKK